MVRFTELILRLRAVILIAAAGLVVIGGIAGRDVATHLVGGTSVPAIGESAEVLEQAAT